MVIPSALGATSSLLVATDSTHMLGRLVRYASQGRVLGAVWVLIGFSLFCSGMFRQ